MSGRRSNNKGSNNNGGGGTGVSSIPATSRKMVQSLKEIVNCPDDEIYSMLKECDMDPNDTVNRLLSQDTFHEVKSKRDKKKEVKESPDSRPRSVSTTSSRGGRGGATRYDGRDPGVLRGKPAYKKENGGDALSSSSPSPYASSYGLSGNNNNRHSVSYSAVAADFKPLTTGAVSGSSSSSNLSPGFQPAWAGAPGQVSMADIVKMGRRKASGTPNKLSDTPPSLHNSAEPATSNQNVSHPIASAPLPREPQYSSEVIPESVPKVSEYIHETSGLESQHSSPEEWKLPEQPSAEVASNVEPSETTEVYTDSSIPSNLQSDKTWSDEFQGAERDAAEHSYLGSASASDRQIQSDNNGHTSHFDEDSYGNINSYPPQRHTHEHHEGDGGSSQLSIPNYSVSPVDDVKIAVSSAAANLQQLSLQEERGLTSAEVNPAVIIPNHLQIPTAECSHLSFGSFGSISSSFPGSYASNSLKNNVEETSVAPNTSADHSVNRDPEYFGDEHIQLRSDGNAASRTSAGAGSYDSLPQSEVMRQEGSEAIHGHQYNFPTSVPGYTLENNSQLNAAFPYEQTNSQMQSLAPLSSVMQAYSNSLQGNPLAPTDQPARESSDHTYSAFLTSQSMPTKYNTAGSSNGPSLSLPENMKSGMFSMPHPSGQALAGTNIATGPALPQHLAVHPYSQPTLPLGFTNMIGYPFLPQSYAYMPPAYQQAYAGNSTYHQSPAAVHNAGMKYTLPQYKSNVSVSSLPQSASAASAYGGFGSSVNMPGSYQLNPSTTTSSTTVGYDDLMSSQYKESNHFHPLLPLHMEGLGSRPMSALPASTYYSFQGQGQQHNGYRQGQQPSQHYGNLGYQNFYHSQAGVPQEHQQQTPNDGALSGSQGAQSKQSHQMWQHSY